MTSLKNKFREEFLKSFREELFKEELIKETSKCPDMFENKNEAVDDKIRVPMEINMNKWIKQKCANFTMIPFGLEELGEMVEVSTFTRGEDIITQYMIESDHSYVFAELDEGETTWKLLSRIPDEIIRQIDYLAWEEADIAIP